MGDKQYGRWKRKPKNLRYQTGNHRFKNKLKRVRQSSGEAAASKYARRHLRGME